MNPDTRVSVHCYAGDGHQVRDALELYTHHDCPITVLSPADSPVTIEGLDCRYAGQRDGSVEHRLVDGAIRIVTKGPIANQRQVEQMKVLLSYPENFFLMNDADSFCLSPKFPDYLYQQPDIVWCNHVNDTLPMNQPGYAGYPPDFPHAALQPPYFLSRRSMERLLSVVDQIVPNEVMPWIDHFMLQMAYKAKVPYRRFPDSVASDVDRYPQNLAPALDLIRRNGAVFVHSSKSPVTWRPMQKAREDFLNQQRIVARQPQSKGLKA
jgi:hypothetical protein